jgi:hypothetical protein
MLSHEIAHRERSVNVAKSTFLLALLGIFHEKIPFAQMPAT